MQPLSGDIRVKDKIISFLKEHSLKIIAGLLFLVFVLFFVVDMLTRRSRINPITEKIAQKIESLKDKSSEINTDRHVANEIKNVKIEHSEEKSIEISQEYNKLNEIEDVHIRLNSKIKFYDKISK